MRALPDLHPDDLAMRVMIRDLLIHYRTRDGIGQRELAKRMGLTQGAVSKFERGTSWLVSSLQRRAGVHDRRLVVRLVGLPEPPDEVLALAAMRPTDPVRAEAWDRAAVAAELAAARNTLGVTQEQVGEVLGCGKRAVAYIEGDDKDALLVSWQRYCRALGGALWVGLEES